MSSPPTVAAAPNPTALTALQAPANDDPIEPQVSVPSHLGSNDVCTNC